MATLTARIPELSGQLTAPLNAGLENIKTVQHKAAIAGHRKIIHSKRMMMAVAYTAVYRVAEYLIPEDAYDWEDAEVAEFLGEDLNA